MSLEADLRTLAAAVEWPPTPEPRLELRPRRSRRPLLAAVVLAAALALAAAFAVPGSRGAILRFLHLRGVTIELVDRLPAAQERPLSADLGPAVTRAAAEQRLGTRVLLPPLDPTPPLHLTGSAVAVLLRERGEPVLLSELAGGDPVFLKKVVATGTSIEYVRVDGAPGFWISGAPHLFGLGPEAPPRLAGNVLLWQVHGLTLRLEGRALDRTDALALAHSLR